MTRTAMTRTAVLASIVLLVIAARPAFAYVDPGTGGMLMQLLIGGLMGGLVLLKSSWQRIKGWFNRSGSADKGDR